MVDDDFADVRVGDQYLQLGKIFRVRIRDLAHDCEFRPILVACPLRKRFDLPIEPGDLPGPRRRADVEHRASCSIRRHVHVPASGRRTLADHREDASAEHSVCGNSCDALATCPLGETDTHEWTMLRVVVDWGHGDGIAGSFTRPTGQHSRTSAFGRKPFLAARLEFRAAVGPGPWPRCRKSEQCRESCSASAEDNSDYPLSQATGALYIL